MTKRRTKPVSQQEQDKRQWWQKQKEADLRKTDWALDRLLSGTGTPFALSYRYGDKPDGGMISLYTIAWLRGLRERKALSSLPTSLSQQSNHKQLLERTEELCRRMFLERHEYWYYGALVEVGNVMSNVPRYMDITGITHVMIPAGSVIQSHYGISERSAKAEVTQLSSTMHLDFLDDELMSKRKIWERVLTDIEDLYKGV